MGSELRWGIIGCGVISNDFVHALRNCRHKQRVVAAAASSLDRAQEMVKKHNLDAKAYGDYSELLADENVDVVYIGLLNQAHLKWILASLDAGKHVLCEKPMVLNVDEMKQVIEQARDKKLFIMEAHWSRFFPVWRKIRETIESKELGELKIFGMNFSEQLCENRFHLDKGEDPAIDIGYYVTALSMYAFGEEKPENIQVVGEKNSDGVDLWSNITFKFSNGKHALLYYNGTMRGSTSAYFAFEKGLIEIPYFSWCPESFVKIKGGVEEGHKEEFNFPLNDYEGYNLNNCAGLHYEADHVYEKINEGATESEVMSLKNSLQVAEVVEEIRRQLGVKFHQE